MEKLSAVRLPIFTRSRAPLLTFGIPEFRVSSISLAGFRLRVPASLTPANHLNLELAKGFEPLTL
jgi:hypothetical protein